MNIKKHSLTALCSAAVLLGAMPLGGGFTTADAAAQIVFENNACTVFEDGAPFKGVDISSVISLEQSGVVFRDANGNPKDIFATLKENGVNTVRVRIWNDPNHSQTGASYGGGACDTACAEAIAKRCAAVGLKLMPDFHYSDFWADPAKQKAPKAWADYSHQQKQQAIHDFTLATLRQLAATGVEIPMVQVGNETTGGMCGTLLSDYDWSAEGWQLVTDLYNAGASAVREFDRSTLVALHFTNPEKTGNYEYYAKMLKHCGADYDVFASSYYPYWHGTMQNLTSVLNTVAKNYNKMVMVAETSWLYTKDNTDLFANTISGNGDLGEYVSYDISTQGQIDCISDVFEAVKAVENGKGIGVFYWEPAWLPVGNDYNGNLQKWEKDGSGWATQAAQEYDPDAKYYGGSAVDNQALFDANGVPLASLAVFADVHGNKVIADSNNLLQNPGFDADGGWTATPKAWQLHATADGHFDVRAEDIKDGGCALHWYSEKAFSGSSAQTEYQAAKSGAYAFTMQLQGDESSAYTVEIAVNGKIIDSKQGNLSGWSNWQGIRVNADASTGDTITMRLIINGGDGAYGSADACTLYYSEAAVTTTASATTSTTTSSETTTTTSSDAEPHYGDTNNDGFVRVDDVILLNRFLAEDSAVSITQQGMANADANRDGSVNNSDATEILRMLAGIQTPKNKNRHDTFVPFL